MVMGDHKKAKNRYTADQVRDLIKHLLAIGERQEGLVRAFIEERSWAYENCEDLRALGGDIEAPRNSQSVRTSFLTVSIGPLLTLGLAVVVGFFALAIYLPMWDMTQMAG